MINRDSRNIAFESNVTARFSLYLPLRHQSYRKKTPCSLDAQQDHPKGHRELQNHARAKATSADIEDKIIMTQES